MFSKRTALVWVLGLSLVNVPALAGDQNWDASGSDSDANYDRLDGHGKSGKKVNVVEWEGNLEVHVYPKGSLKSLALKLDKKNKKKPVMVIGYNFGDSPNDWLVRRAILGINLHEGFKAYKDPSADDYDKIVISNNGLASPMIAFNYEQPKQLYPDGHPALKQPERDVASEEKREPAQTTEKRETDETDKNVDQESGTVKPFFVKEFQGRRHN